MFAYDVSVRGTVFEDRNHNGRQDWQERGLPGWGVQVLDSAGNVVSSTMTLTSGGYSFSGLDLGTYTVQVVPPAGWTQTGGNGGLQITRGIRLAGVDFGFAQPGSPVNPPPPTWGGPPHTGPWMFGGQDARLLA